MSWYEAAAFAVFEGKSLPVIAQWFRAAPPFAARYLAPVSNLSSSSPAEVGHFKGIGPWGTYDMAGNVREWCANGVRGEERRFILGGMWTSPSYLYGDPEALPPFDRSEGNGFRLVRNRGPVPAAAREAKALFDSRDPAHLKPASDEAFRAYRSLYEYDKFPLRARVEATDAAADWVREKVSFDAAYGDERVPAFVFLPKSVRPPYQAVVFFPSARVYHIASSATLGDMEFVDYVIQSGRAVIYPVYQATYERLSPRDRERRATLPSAARGREVLIEQAKDVQRAVDYLESRPDIDAGRIGYLGVSMGSAFGVIFGAVEGRFKAIVWLDGGLFLDKPAPGTDQVDFAPRIRKPVLMIERPVRFRLSARSRPAPAVPTPGDACGRQAARLSWKRRTTSRRRARNSSRTCSPGSTSTWVPCSRNRRYFSTVSMTVFRVEIFATISASAFDSPRCPADGRRWRDAFLGRAALQGCRQVVGRRDFRPAEDPVAIRQRDPVRCPHVRPLRRRRPGRTLLNTGRRGPVPVRDRRPDRLTRPASQQGYTGPDAFPRCRPCPARPPSPGPRDDAGRAGGAGPPVG